MLTIKDYQSKLNELEVNIIELESNQKIMLDFIEQQNQYIQSLQTDNISLQNEIDNLYSEEIIYETLSDN